MVAVTTTERSLISVRSWFTRSSTPSSSALVAFPTLPLTSVSGLSLAHARMTSLLYFLVFPHFPHTFFPPPLLHRALKCAVEHDPWALYLHATGVPPNFWALSWVYRVVHSHCGHSPRHGGALCLPARPPSPLVPPSLLFSLFQKLGLINFPPPSRVEFNNKFYQGTGFLFRPFAFDHLDDD